MSHLGENVSALVDGELSHMERERVLAHLALCAECRREVEAVRALKSRLRALDPPAMPIDLTMSLLLMGEPGEPMTPRERPFPGTFGGVPLPGPRGIAPLDNRPRRGPSGAFGPGTRRRGAYLAMGMVSAAVALSTLFVATASQTSGPPPATVHKTSVP